MRRLLLLAIFLLLPASAWANSTAQKGGGGGSGAVRTSADCANELAGSTGELCVDTVANQLFGCEVGPCKNTNPWTAYSGGGAGDITAVGNCAGPGACDAPITFGAGIITMAQLYVNAAGGRMDLNSADPVFGITDSNLAGNAAGTGVIRLENTMPICWLNAAGTGDDCLSVGADDLLTFTKPIQQYTDVIDPNTTTDFCADMRTVLANFNNGVRSVNLLVRHGAATITNSQIDTENDRGGFDGCYQIGSMTDPLYSYTNGADGKPLRLHITWDDVTLFYDPTGQAENVILASNGDSYASGSVGDQTNGVVTGSFSQSGQKTWKQVGAGLDDNGVGTDWVAGDIPNLPQALYGSVTSTIYEMYSNVHFINEAGYTLSIEGSNGTPVTDVDDIGIVVLNSFSNDFGKWKVTHVGTGMLWLGFNGTAVAHVDSTQNEVNMVYGQFYKNGEVPYDDSTADSATWPDDQTKGGIIADGDLEGAAVHGIVVFANDLPGPEFRDVYLEAGGGQTGYSVLLGGGQCSASPNRTCSVDLDCGAGTCDDLPTAASEVRSPVFLGGSIGGGGGAHPEVIALGPGANMVDAIGAYPIVFGATIGNCTTANGCTFLTANATADAYVNVIGPADSNTTWSPTYTNIYYGETGIKSGVSTTPFTWDTRYMQRRRLQWTTDAGAVTHNLPTPDVSQKPFTLCQQGAGALKIDPGAAHSIILQGLTLSADEAIVSGAAGSCVTLDSISATQWLVTSWTGTWSDEGATGTVPAAGGFFSTGGGYIFPTTATDDLADANPPVNWSILNTGAATFSGVTTTPHATNGGVMTLSEGVDDGSATWALKVPDSGMTGNTAYTCTVTASGLIPASCLSATAVGEVPRVIASGATVITAGLITSGTCDATSNDHITASGVASTDVITWTPNADLSLVTGFTPLTTGGLYLSMWPTAGEVNVSICNPTAGDINPTDFTLNWRVTR